MALAPWIIPAVAGGASFLGGMSAAKAQKEQSRRQAQLIQKQSQLFSQTMPYYGQLLQNVAGSFGGQQQQLAQRAAEEDVRRYYEQQANQLRHRMGGGASSSALNAALARLGSQQATELARFRRQSVLDEPQRRIQALAPLLGLGFGQGSQAAAGYGQQANMFGNQAAAGFGGAGNILQQYMYMQALQNQQPQVGLADTYRRGQGRLAPDTLAAIYSQPPLWSR